MSLSRRSPEITLDQSRKILSGLGRFQEASKTAKNLMLKDYYAQLQLISKLDYMARGESPPPTGFERLDKTDEQRRLQKQVEEAKKKLPEQPADSEKRLRTAMEAAERRIDNQIADLEHEIETKQKIVKNKTKLEYNKDLKDKIARRDALKKTRDEIFAPGPLTDAQRLELWNKHAREQIDRLNKKRESMLAGTWKPKEKPAPVPMDKEAVSLRYEQHKIHKALLDIKIKDELARRTTAKKSLDSITNFVRFTRMAMAGGEFSAVLKQGATGHFGHPIITAKAMAKMFQAMMSAKKHSSA